LAGQGRLSLSFIGGPASPPGRRALEAYASWLHMERRLLCLELYPEMGSAEDKVVYAGNARFDWHFSGRDDLAWNEGAQPSSRAVAVLDLASVDWRNANFTPSVSRPPRQIEDPVLSPIENHKRAS